MRKKSKRFLSLVLALMICMGTLIMAVNAEEDAQPELPLADVAVPVTMAEGHSWEWDTYDAVRITHVVSQETVMYEGEPMELYSIYPGAMVWKTKTDGYSPSSMKAYKATLENGTLTAGELDFELEIPLNFFGYLCWDEDSVGNYYVAEISESYLNKKIGIHVVEGNLPENAPIYYVYDVAMTREATYNGDTNIYTVPAGTVVTLPYDTAGGHKSSSRYCRTNVSSTIAQVEPFMCNGRESFTVEPGKLYEVNYTQNAFFINEIGVIEGGINEAHIYIAAEDTSPTTYTAKPTNDALKVDGKSQVPTAYKIGDSNYFQLRDVAMMLSGTPAQFSVDYDEVRQAVVIVTGEAYTPQGWELGGAAQNSTEAILGNNDIYINGVKTDFAVYKIGGANFFQIRALGQALGFNVGWTAEQGMFIESDKPYVSPNN